jgi:hypothetical protein
MDLPLIPNVPDEVVIFLLNSFLDSKDTRFISHCSHKCREYIKSRGLLHYHFDTRASLAYYSNVVDKDIKHLGNELVNEVERRGGKVMGLSFINFEFGSGPRCLPFVSSVLERVHKLNLCKVRGTMDINKVCSVRDLNLSYCTQVSDADIINLGSVSKLNLSGCKRITNVSHLAGVGELILNSCTGITSGLDKLGGVLYLDLGNCTQLRDEDMVNLSAVTKLSLSGCKNITTLTLSEGVKYIYAPYCACLTSIVLPSSLTSIVSNAFIKCTSLKYVEIPSSSIKCIGSSAFEGCTALTTVTMLGTALKSIEKMAFKGCSSLVTIAVQPLSSTDIITGINFNKCDVYNMHF